MSMDFLVKNPEHQKDLMPTLARHMQPTIPSRTLYPVGLLPCFPLPRPTTWPRDEHEPGMRCVIAGYQSPDSPNFRPSPPQPRRAVPDPSSRPPLPLRCLGPPCSRPPALTHNTQLDAVRSTNKSAARGTQGEMYARAMALKDKHNLK